MANFKWKRRTDEWMKANPGSPYMYKEYDGVPPVEEAKIEKIEKFNPSMKSKGASGIYVIICTKEMCAYVGQSKNIEVRLRSHKMAMQSEAKAKNTVYSRMHSDVCKHGIDSFEFIIHQHCHEHELLNEESKAMTYYIQSGYSLYNKVVTVYDDSVFCPVEHQLLMKKIIGRLHEKGFLDKINSLLNG